MLEYIRRCYQFWKLVVVHFDEVSTPTRAASLSYTTVLSIVPLAVMGLGILSAFPVFESYADKIQNFIFSHFVAGSADIIREQINSFASQAAELSATSILFLLIAAVMMIFTMESALNAIWRIETRRHGVTAFLMYWAVLTLLPILIGAGMATSVYLYSLPYIKGAAEKITDTIPLFTFVPFFFEWAGFTTIYMTLPNTKVLFRDASVGALVAAILFEIVKRGFAVYVTNFSSYEFIYGALSALPIFLVWVYVSWLIILFGAVISYTKNLTRQQRINS